MQLKAFAVEACQASLAMSHPVFALCAKIHHATYGLGSSLCLWRLCCSKCVRAVQLLGTSLLLSQTMTVHSMQSHASGQYCSYSQSILTGRPAGFVYVVLQSARNQGNDNWELAVSIWLPSFSGPAAATCTDFPGFTWCHEVSHVAQGPKVCVCSYIGHCQ